jgi:hypothetical protein
MPEKKTQTSPLMITFNIDPVMKVNEQGQRCMAVSVVAKQGEIGQVSQFDMTNWKTDIAAEVDRVMRLLMSGSLQLPNFPNMDQAAPAPASSTPDSDDSEPDEGMEDEAAEEFEPSPDGVEESEGLLDEYADYEMTLYEPEEDGAGSQGTLF